jgi:hypothetical protein
MKNLLLLITFILSFLAFFPSQSFAQSDYVLPYPSAMPGSIWYKIHLVQEKIDQFWYFGSFGQFDYNLKQSDKYLVEAKTLFEYRQFLLAYEALKKSDAYFQKVPYYLNRAEQEGKNIIDKKKILKAAALRHSEVLNRLQKEVPDTFFWQPEKKSATDLNIKQEVENSIVIRSNIL